MRKRQANFDYETEELVVLLDSDKAVDCGLIIQWEDLMFTDKIIEQLQDELRIITEPLLQKLRILQLEVHGKSMLFKAQVQRSFPDLCKDNMPLALRNDKDGKYVICHPKRSSAYPNGPTFGVVFGPNGPEILPLGG